MRPATRAQTRFYLLDQREGGVARTLVKRIRVRGDVDGRQLRRAFLNVTRLEPALRSRLELAEGSVHQTVLPADCVSCELSPVAAQYLDEQSDRVAAAFALQPFEHAAGPLCRAEVLACDGVGAELVIAVHHAMFDETSNSLLLRRLRETYGGAALDDDRVSWHEQTEPERAPEEVVAASAFWPGYLVGLPDDPLRFGSVSSVESVSAYQSVRRRVGEEGVAGMQRVLMAHGWTRFTVFLSAVSWALTRLADRCEVTLATVVDTRSAQLAEQIGCLQNTVPVRIAAPEPGQDIEVFADGVLDSFASALEHATTPIEEILALLGTAGIARPRIDALCVETRVPEHSDDRGRTWTLHDEPAQEAEFDLAFALHHENPGLEVVLDFKPAAVEPGQAQVLLEAITRALELLVGGDRGADDRGLGQVALNDPVSSADLAKALALTMGPALSTDPGPTVCHQVLARCRESPESIAVSGRDSTLTYGELDTRSGRLAGALADIGVTRGARVGLSVEAGPDVVAAMLATHRLGAAFVPLDPDLPTARRGNMAAEAGLAAVIGAERSRLPAVPLVDLSTLEPSTYPHTDALPTADDVAYVIFTSGSTGKPKGVAIEHGSLSSLLAACEQVHGPLPDVVVSGTNASFDISLLELWWPLCLGRRLSLVDHRTLRSEDIPTGALYQCTPTVAALATSHADGRAALARVGTLLVGGEALPQDVADRLLGIVSGRVVNCYGPTETTVWSTTQVLDVGSAVSIGRPLPGEACFVVDRHGGVLPLGFEGRLFVSGSGLARGYHEQPELTRARFRPLPAADQCRAYDTGDRAVMGADGTLWFRGRSDDQLKVLGHRIEPQEVEAVIRRHDAVLDAMVVAAPAARGLWCYIADGGPPSDRPQPVSDELRDSLSALARRELSEAVVPRRFWRVAELPRTTSEKVSRSEVRRWTASTSAEPGTVGASRGPLEDAWQAVLGVDVDDPDLTFFDLGGSSADLVAVLGLLQPVFPTLSVADLFRFPTIRRLREHLAESAAPGGDHFEAGDGAVSTTRETRRARAAEAIGSVRNRTRDARRKERP